MLSPLNCVRSLKFIDNGARTCWVRLIHSRRARMSKVQSETSETKMAAVNDAKKIIFISFLEQQLEDSSDEGEETKELGLLLSSLRKDVPKVRDYVERTVSEYLPEQFRCSGCRSIRSTTFIL